MLFIKHKEATFHSSIREVLLIPETFRDEKDEDVDKQKTT